jgi:hypothetical protein
MGLLVVIYLDLNSHYGFCSISCRSLCSLIIVHTEAGLLSSDIHFVHHILSKKSYVY